MISARKVTFISGLAQTFWEGGSDGFFLLKSGISFDGIQFLFVFDLSGGRSIHFTGLFVAERTRWRSGRFSDRIQN